MCRQSIFLNDTVFVSSILFVFDAPVVGYDTADSKPRFSPLELHLCSGWMLKLHIVPSGICVGNLLHPLQELLGTKRAG